jgi:hypothetical protein
LPLVHLAQVVVGNQEEDCVQGCASRRLTLEAREKAKICIKFMRK